MFNNNEIKDRLQKNYRAGSFKLSNPDKKNWDMAMKVANFICDSIVTGKQIGRASCRERVSSPV